MRVIGSATKADLLEMQRRGISPKDAVDALMAEAKRRHPNAVGVVIRQAQDGFDIVAL